MDKNELEHYKYIDFLNNLSSYSKDKYKNAIILFNEYISSNRNYKYNKTYLSDSIDDFFRTLDTYFNKREITKKLYKEVQSKNIDLKKYLLVIDNIFVIAESGLSIIPKKLEKCNYKQDIILSTELRYFKLFNFNSHFIVVNYYSYEDYKSLMFTEKICLSSSNRSLLTGSVVDIIKEED